MRHNDHGNHTSIVLSSKTNESGEKQMDIESLRTFINLYDTKSYTRTADQLFVAQSTVTNRINELEKELHTKLFERTNRSVKLTPEGEKFKDYAEKVIELTDTSLAEIASNHHFETTPVGHFFPPIHKAALKKAARYFCLSVMSFKLLEASLQVMSLQLQGMDYPLSLHD